MVCTDRSSLHTGLHTAQRSQPRPNPDSDVGSAQVLTLATLEAAMLPATEAALEGALESEAGGTALCAPSSPTAVAAGGRPMYESRPRRVPDVVVARYLALAGASRGSGAATRASWTSCATSGFGPYTPADDDAHAASASRVCSSFSSSFSSDS